jgi:putative endonuclease
MTKGGSVYIMTNKLKTTLYIGVTSDLQVRIRQHKDHFFKAALLMNTTWNIVCIMKTFFQ